MIDRLLHAAALAAALSVAVAACGGGDPLVDGNPEARPGEPTRDAALRDDTPAPLPATSSTPGAARATIAARPHNLE